MAFVPHALVVTAGATSSLRCSVACTCAFKAYTAGSVGESFLCGCERGKRLRIPPQPVKRIGISQLGGKIVWIFLQGDAVLRLGVSIILLLAKCFGSCQSPDMRLA